jgi:hypothetical protein
MPEHRGARWWRDLDAILRRSEPGQTQLERSLGRLLLGACVCGGVYGSFVGWFSVKSFGWPGFGQLLAAALKIPLLFLLTLAVTFPSLYLFSALLDSPMGFRQTLRLLLTAILVTLAGAASFGPILGFFTVSTESYAFMILLNTALLGVAGLIGMAFLIVRLRGAGRPDRAEGAAHEPEPVGPPEVAGVDLPPRIAAWSKAQARRPQFGDFSTGARRGSGLLQLWIVIYGLVGVQMAWVLRPFIGNPDGPMALFRPVGGNFFEAIFHALERFLGL